MAAGGGVRVCARLSVRREALEEASDFGEEVGVLEREVEALLEDALVHGLPRRALHLAARGMGRAPSAWRAVRTISLRLDASPAASTPRLALSLLLLLFVRSLVLIWQSTWAQGRQWAMALTSRSCRASS